MNKLETKLKEIRARAKSAPPALMTHVVLGYPSLRESVELARAMADNGAALIELQLPFSDPMADGPTIMAANEAALEQGVKIADCFRAAERLAKKISVPLLFMSYFNIVYRHPGGVRGFVRHAAAAGIEGLIVPDIPPEESADGYWSEAAKAGVAPIPVVAPVSGPERLKAIRKVTSGGFVYCVSTTGTTGARRALPDGLPAYLRTVKGVFNLPVAVGFGISSPAQVGSLRGVADIAVVGSAMIDVVKNGPAGSRVKRAADFTRRLSRG